MSERGLALHKAGNECQRRRTHLADCITLFQKLTKVLKEEAQTFHTITVIILTLLLVCFGRGKVNFFVSYEGSAPTGGEYFFTHNVLETMEKHRQSCLSKLQPKEFSTESSFVSRSVHKKEGWFKTSPRCPKTSHQAIHHSR